MPPVTCNAKSEQELFCQELFFYKDLKKERENLKNQISILISVFKRKQKVCG